MGAVSLIAEIAAAGGEISLNGDKLRVAAPPEFIAAARDRIRLHQPEIIALLRDGDGEEAPIECGPDLEPASASSEDPVASLVAEAERLFGDCEVLFHPDSIAASDALYRAEVEAVRRMNAAAYAKRTPWKSR